jgi:hypothetical protein
MQPSRPSVTLEQYLKMSTEEQEALSARQVGPVFAEMLCNSLNSQTREKPEPEPTPDR